MQNVQAAAAPLALIQPAPVARDQDGYWVHPEEPDFDEDWQAYKAWIVAQGLELKIDDLEDYPDHAAHHRYFEEGEADISDWVSERPAGEGWFTLSIHMTEDSAVWVWARRRQEGAAG